MTETPSTTLSKETARLAHAAARRDWYRAFQNLPREHGFEDLRIEGTVPEGLQGTLYRVGPGLFDNMGYGYDHWFDGDGAVSAVRIEAGKAMGAVKVVQSKGLAEERAAQKPLFAGYGTLPPGPFWRRFWPRIKNTANTATMLWQDQLFALMEGARPTRIDPNSLDTIGEADWGVLQENFTAHPHHVAARDCTYGFALHYGRKASLRLYALPKTGAARRLGEVTLQAPTMVHDFIATEKFLIFFLSPLRMKPLPLLFGQKSFSEVLYFAPQEGTEILLIPIDEPSKPVRFQTEAFHQWHFANAFSRGSEVVVDYVHYQDFSSNEWLRQLFQGKAYPNSDGFLHRAVIDPAKKTFKTERIGGARTCEFPITARHVMGATHRYIYAVAHRDENPDSKRGVQQSIVCFDTVSNKTQEFFFGENCYSSEPVPVEKANATQEQSVWLLCLVYDAMAHTNHVAILDAERLEQGPVAKLHFDHHLPFTFHGTWQAF